MTKFKHFETGSGKTIMTAQFDGYNIAERMLEGLMFQITVQSDGSLKASVKTEDEDFFSNFNTIKFLNQAEDYACKNADTFQDPVSGEDCWLVVDGEDSNKSTTVQPITVQKVNIETLTTPEKEACACGGNCGCNTSSEEVIKATPDTGGAAILETLFPDKAEEVTEEEKKETVIGKFKPKRQFLNFIQGRKGGVRYHTDVAYIKSEELTGTIEGAIFKVTICDEGTINFEETDTKFCDDAMIQRFIDDIDGRDVTGYMQKFVVYKLGFTDGDGKSLYLEVEYKKPIDKLFALFDELKEPENMEKEEVKVSDNAQSLLDSLFGDEPKSEVVETTEQATEEVKVVETYAQQMMRESFEAMNAEKLKELTERIEKKEKDINKYKLDIRQSESNLKTASDDVRVLYTRLDSLKTADSPNGFIFYVSPENTSGVVVDQALQTVVKQIAPLLKLNEEKVIEFLTKGFFTIKIAKKGDLTNENVSVDKEIYEKITKIDATGKVTMVGATEFEYRGELTWHKLVDKMIRMGFEQEPEFDKQCGSPSYQSEDQADQSGGFKLTLDSGGNLTQTNIPSTGVGNGDPFSYKEEDGKHTETFVQKELIKYDTPTTLVVVGDGTHNTSQVMIDDDETSFDLYIGGIKYNRGKSTWSNSYCSMGFANVMTLDEYKAFYDSNKDMFEEYEGLVEGFVIPNFTGTIGVSSELNGKFSNDFDLSDYIYHQTSGTVVLNLPDGTKVYDLNTDLSLPLDIIRDAKIEQIIK